MKRGEIWCASLPAPHGPCPGYRRPVVVVQSNDFNESRIQTVVIAAITSNLNLAAAPGNFAVSSRETGLQEIGRERFSAPGPHQVIAHGADRTPGGSITPPTR